MTIDFPFLVPVADYSKALLYSKSHTQKSVAHLYSLYVSTSAILFLGTPYDVDNESFSLTCHRMIENSLLAKDTLLAKDSFPAKDRLHSEVSGTKRQSLDVQRVDLEALRDINDSFEPIMGNFSIFFFWEQEKTKIGSAEDYVRPSIICNAREV